MDGNGSNPLRKNLAHLFSPAAQYFREASATTIFGYDAIPLAAGVIVAAGVTLAVMNLAWFETPKTATNKTGT